MNSLLRAQRARLARAGKTGDEAGFSLVEVVVAMALFAVMASSVLGVMVKSMNTAGDNRARVTTASLASAQIESVRGQTVASIPTSTSTRTQTVANRTYTIAQSARFVSDDGGTSACSSTAVAIAYKLITVTVTWPQMGNIAPVRSDTLMTATATGAFAVTVIGASGQPQVGLPVTLSPGASSVTTDDAGCAVFPDLTPGAYTGTVSQPGYIVPGGTSTTATTTGNVIAQQITKTTVSYDKATTLNVVYTTPTGTPLSASDVALLPQEFGSGTLSSTYGSTTKTLPNGFTSLYPSSYSLTSGGCTMGTADLTAGGGGTTTLNIPTRKYTLTNWTTLAGIGIMTAKWLGPVAGSTIDCPVGTKVNIGFAFSLFGTPTGVLPLGNWQIEYPWNPAALILGLVPLLTSSCINIPVNWDSIFTVAFSLAAAIADPAKTLCLR